MTALDYADARSAEDGYTYTEALVILIRHRMALLELNQGALAELVGMSRQSLSHRLNGRTKLNVLDLVNIAEVLGTTGTELVERAERLIEVSARPSEDVSR